MKEYIGSITMVTSDGVTHVMDIEADCETLPSYETPKTFLKHQVKTIYNTLSTDDLQVDQISIETVDY